jgi:DNA-binding Lrp family transcriptional regulator
LDNLDTKLIGMLRHDARASISELASRLGWSRTTVRTRMSKLLDSGEIVGFSVVLKSDHIGDPVRGLMMIAIEGRGTDRIVRQLNAMPEIRQLHSTNGRWDIIVEIGTGTLEHLDEVLGRIRRLDGVAASETSLLLSTRKAS